MPAVIEPAFGLDGYRVQNTCTGLQWREKGSYGLRDGLTRQGLWASLPELRGTSYPQQHSLDRARARIARTSEVKGNILSGTGGKPDVRAVQLPSSCTEIFGQSTSVQETRERQEYPRRGYPAPVPTKVHPCDCQAAKSYPEPLDEHDAFGPVFPV